MAITLTGMLLTFVAACLGDTLDRPNSAGGFGVPRIQDNGFKVCSCCGLEKPARDYYKNRRMGDGLSGYCKTCKRHYAAKYAATLHVKFKKCSKCGATKTRQHFYPNTRHSRDGLHTWCKDCARAVRKQYYADNRRVVLAREKACRRAAVLSLIQNYGGRCECCGEARFEFLTLDHKLGSGGRHRKRLGSSRAVFREVLRLGCPSGAYRLLCYNCNCAIGRFGYCPHQREKAKCQ